MFNLGPGELLLVCALIFIFVKPEELPAFIRKMGNLYSRLKGIVVEVRELGNNLSRMPDHIDKEADIQSIVEDDDTKADNDDLLDAYLNPDLED